MAKDKLYALLQKGPITRDEMKREAKISAGTLHRILTNLEKQDLLQIDKNRRPWTYKFRTETPMKLLYETNIKLPLIQPDSVNLGQVLRNFRTEYEREPENFQQNILTSINTNPQTMLSCALLTIMDDTTSPIYKRTWDVDVMKKIIKDITPFIRPWRTFTLLIDEPANNRTLAHYGIEIDEADKEILQTLRRLVFDRWPQRDNP
jgi:hypothetical protein